MCAAGSLQQQTWLRMAVVSGGSAAVGAFEVGSYWMFAVGRRDRRASACPLLSPFPQARGAIYSPP